MPRRLPVFLLMLSACAAEDPGAGAGPGPAPVDSTVAESNLHFLRPALTAPPLADRVESFWAVRGQTREIRLMYQPGAGQLDSVEFARFRVESRSLVNDQNGQPIAQGDSILISLTIVDTLRLITDFQPAGLIFNPNRPARLWLKFGEADPDLNNDGIVTAADTTLLFDLSIWRQEGIIDPWVLVQSVVDTLEQEVEADIPGFTRYAVAY